MSSLGEIWQDFVKGFFTENPLTRLMIGLCASLAISTKVENGLFLGIGATFVLVFSNIIIASIRKIIPDQVRIPIFIVVIASFVTIVDLTMKAYFPAAYARLGVWIPLIVVNCIILGRAEAFASKHPIGRSAADGLGMGFGYILVLLIMGFIRELTGTGAIVLFGKTLISLGSGFQPPTIMIMFPGAFLTFGLLLGLINRLQNRE
jgi:electron transport complex protein RnfE